MSLDHLNLTQKSYYEDMNAKKILKHFRFPFLFYFILGSLGCHVGDGNKNVKQTNKQSSSFRLAKRQLNFARAALFLVHFFVVTTRLRRKISCFMENVGKRLQISLSFDEFRYPIFDIQFIFLQYNSRRVRLHLTK